MVLPSNHSSLDRILNTFNSTVLQCKQEIDKGIFQQDTKVIFIINKNTAIDLLSMAKSIFSPNSYFRSMPKVAIAFASGEKIMIYRQVIP